MGLVISMEAFFLPIRGFVFLFVSFVPGLCWFFLSLVPEALVEPYGKLKTSAALVLTATLAYAVAVYAFRRAWSSSTLQLPHIGAVVREVRSSAAASMPWPLVPLLWLTGIRFDIAGERINFQGLLILAAIWFPSLAPNGP